jgi:hypothetical protein
VTYERTILAAGTDIPRIEESVEEVVSTHLLVCIVVAISFRTYDCSIGSIEYIYQVLILT